ncbi:MAG: arylsulfotransferase family protein [Phycisphaerae bacterium]
MMQLQSSWRFARLVLIGAALLHCCGACDRSSDSAKKDQNTKSRIDDLRGLPYAGTVVGDDPEHVGVVYVDPQRTEPGYNLVTLAQLSEAVLIDAEGQTIKSWSISPSRRWSHCILTPSGDLYALGADNVNPPQPHVTAKARYLAHFNWDGELVSKHQLPVHHDVELQPNGNVLALTFDSRIIPEVHKTITSRNDTISEISPRGTVVHRLSLYEALSNATDGFKLQEVAPKKWGRSQIIDLFHANSIETMRRRDLAEKNPIFGLDNILVCIRHQDTIAIIDRKSEKAIWTWGQNEISGPHDATVLDNGHILLFDNGLGRDWSRVIELDPVTKKIVWEYKAKNPTDFYTKSRGSSQRLPNGNTLIAESERGHAFEVTSNGEIVWDYYSPFEDESGERSTLGRIRRYPIEFIEAIEK